jgi:hypothetical protein
MLRNQLIFTLAAVLAVVVQAPAQIKVTTERNTGTDATAEFKFKNVPTPAKDGDATHAKVTLELGERDPAGRDVSTLTDGILPQEEDQPAANFFFNAGSYGGRILFDFGSIIQIEQVNSYSWHLGTRAPQLYNLFASDGSDPKFNAEPDGRTDPVTCGWKLLATVDTRPKQGDPGGQYGVSISDASGSLGKVRYLLFDVVPTETDDPWGNTFFSEIDVVTRK